MWIFCKRGDDQQLQIQLLEQLQPVLRRLVRAAPEGLVDDHEAEGARAHRAPFQAELVGQAGGQDGVGQLFLLAARLAAGIGVVLVFAPSSRQRSLAAKMNQLRTSVTFAVQRRSMLRQALTAAEAVDDPLDLQELGLGILLIVGAGQRAFGAGPQFALKIADLGVRGGLRLQHDVAARGCSRSASATR